MTRPLQCERDAQPRPPTRAGGEDEHGVHIGGGDGVHREALAHGGAHQQRRACRAGGVGRGGVLLRSGMEGGYVEAGAFQGGGGVCRLKA